MTDKRTLSKYYWANKNVQSMTESELREALADAITTIDKISLQIITRPYFQTVVENIRLFSIRELCKRSGINTKSFYSAIERNKYSPDIENKVDTYLESIFTFNDKISQNGQAKKHNHV